MRRVRVPRERVEEWLCVLDEVERAASRLAEVLGRVSVLLHGSFARGDFNLWSDVDLVLVSEVFRGVRHLDRYELVWRLLPPRAEVVAWTPEELKQALEKPAWLAAFRRGVVVVRDEHGVAELLRRAGVEALHLDELRRRVERLLASSV